MNSSLRRLDRLDAMTAWSRRLGQRQAVTKALAGAATEQRISGYLEPWAEEGVRRSWMNFPMENAPGRVAGALPDFFNVEMLERRLGKREWLT